MLAGLESAGNEAGAAHPLATQPTLKGSPGGFQSIQTLASVVFLEIRKEKRIERIGTPLAFRVRSSPWELSAPLREWRINIAISFLVPCTTELSIFLDFEARLSC